MVQKTRCVLTDFKTDGSPRTPDLETCRKHIQTQFYLQYPRDQISWETPAIPALRLTARVRVGVI